MIRMIRKFGWSKNVLIHQIEHQSYEKTLLGQTNFDTAVTPNASSSGTLCDLCGGTILVILPLPAPHASAIILPRDAPLMKLRRMSWSPMWAGQMW